MKIVPKLVSLCVAVMLVGSPHVSEAKKKPPNPPVKKPVMVALAKPAAAPAAAASPPTVPLSLEELAGQKAVLPAPTTAFTVAAAPEGSCQLTGSTREDGKIEVPLDHLDEPSCRGLVGMNTKRTKLAVKLDGKFALYLATVSAGSEEDSDPAAAAADPLTTDGNVITSKLPAAVEGRTAAIYYSDGLRWFKSAQGADGKLVLPAGLQARFRQGDKSAKAYVNVSGDALNSGVRLATLQRLVAAPPKPKPGNWCTVGSTGYTVCLDFYSKRVQPGRHRVEVYPSDTNQVLQPNQSIHVIVLRPVDTTLSLELGGEQGIFAPTDRNLARDQEQHAEHEEPVEPDFTTEEKLFAPRLPGKANLTATLSRGDTQDVQVVEFIVEPTYVGAVRLGVSALFGGATDRGYGVREVAGSKQQEVVVTSKHKADLELVLGYSAYLSPRGYANASVFRFEPYVGVGLLNDSPTGLQTLKSLHAGIEWEPSANFGIALTGVVRRVTRLADGVHVGSPVSGGVPTQEQADLGVGLVFNLSPEFFRVARSEGSSFFK